MRRIAKWIVIGWSLFCLVGVVFGLAAVGQQMDATMTEAEQAGAGIGAGCGMAMWVGIWLAIAGPAAIIFAITGKGEAIAPSAGRPETLPVRLCRECGKYYEGNAGFCPNCGKAVSA